MVPGESPLCVELSNAPIIRSLDPAAGGGSLYAGLRKARSFVTIRDDFTSSLPFAGLSIRIVPHQLRTTRPRDARSPGVGWVAVRMKVLGQTSPE